AVNTLVVTFSEPVTGFDRGDLALTRDGGADLLTAAQTLSSPDGGRTWTLGNLDGITGVAGSYALTLVATGSGVADVAGNLLAADAAEGWAVDTAAPTAAVTPGAPDPRTGPVHPVTLPLSERVTGLDP